LISDDDLLLYYYRDGLDAVDRARIGAAVSDDPQLAQRLQGVVARLDAAAATPEVAVPEDVLRRWQGALARAAQQEGAANEAHAPRAGRFLFDLRWPAAAAVAIVALLVYRDQTTEVMPPGTTPVAASESDASAYERGLKFHLASTEQQLAGLDRADPEERARLVESIIAQNRMYALAAEKAGEPQLARVLRAFAPILESLEHEGGDASANIAQLSFELRVMQGRLSAQAAAPSTAL
jgi:hypothetical protein